MKLNFTLIFSLLILNLFAQSNTIVGAKFINSSKGLSYINFSSTSRYTEKDAELIIKKIYQLDKYYTLHIIRDDRDNLSMNHIRYQLLYKNYLVNDAVIVVHLKNNIISGITGNFNSKKLKLEEIVPAISSENALSKAIEFVHADEYRWQSPSWENHIKETSNDKNATWYPKAEVMLVAINGINEINNYKLAYRFDIYSSKPMNRQYIYIDAANGNVLFAESRLCEANVPGTAQTAYSGLQNIITDSFAGGFRLRETTRGLGVETYNLENGTNTSNVSDFTDTDNYWNNANSSLDEYATDAHWGAEKTFDYYQDNYNRNSLDDNGFKLKSYVHLDVDFFNAYFDGDGANFGDGGNGATPLTSLDVVAHEFTHGLTQFTAGLNYQDESGALNESFSDIFGTAIEFYASPSGGNYLIGDQIGQIIRSMQNPNSYQNPDTYLGDYWYSGTGDNGGVHTNSGVQNFWWYLLVNGGSGINDNNDSYSVTALGIDKSSDIAYRALTYYLIPTSDYADARIASVQAAVDLYGACSNEVISVVNAWHAVGVGDAFVPEVDAAFSAQNTEYCSAPASVTFINQSYNAGDFIWDFGDGNSSTDFNPTHIYTSTGTYTVKLNADGGTCGTDSITQLNFIIVDTSLPCNYTQPINGSNTFLSCDGNLFDSGGPAGNYGDDADVSTTISPVGASGLLLQFDEFSLESGYDYLYIYDGPNSSSPLLGTYSGGQLPEGGAIIPTGPIVTIRLTSDVALNQSGFKLHWNCITNLPLALFESDLQQTCSGIINFSDISFSNPTTWTWDFGDGNTSNMQNPSHTYLNEGVYTVKLIVSNSFGVDSLVELDYITVDKPNGPQVNDESSCLASAITFNATPSSSGAVIHWYQNQTGGNPIFSGSTYTTPVLSSSSTYYVEEQINYPTLFGGALDNSDGGSNYSNATDRYLVFDVYTPVKLVTVKVYAQGDANRTIELRSSGGVTIASSTIFIADGEQTITLNFDLPVGNGFQLGCSGPANMFRNNGTASFPYDVPGILSVTGSNANQAGYYYYYYNWELELPSCISERTEVNALIGVAPVSISPNDISICSNSSVTLVASISDTYLWSNGATTQSIDVNTEDNYSVSITDASGCSGISTAYVNIVAEPIAAFSVSNAGNVYTFSNTSSNALSYNWDFGDGVSSTLQSPSHTYTSGSYTVTLIISNGICNDTLSQSLEVTGLNGVLTNSTISIYPNPTTDNIMIYNLNSSENYIIEITDLLGRNICSYSIISLNHYTINLKNLPEASYFFRIYNSKIDMTKKLIKTN
jgi:bacillolysin